MYLLTSVFLFFASRLPCLLSLLPELARNALIARVSIFRFSPLLFFLLNTSVRFSGFIVPVRSYSQYMSRMCSMPRTSLFRSPCPNSFSACRFTACPRGSFSILHAYGSVLGCSTGISHTTSGVRIFGVVSLRFVPLDGPVLRYVPLVHLFSFFYSCVQAFSVPTFWRGHCSHAS